jgi:hypothetical protein
VPARPGDLDIDGFQRLAAAGVRHATGELARELRERGLEPAERQNGRETQRHRHRPRYGARTAGAG